VNSPPPKPEVILTNFFAEPTVLLVPITSRDIAKLLGVSERTIYHRIQQFNLYVENFSDISHVVLFFEVGKTVKESPFCGENMVMQLQKQRGFRVQRWRLRDALYTLDETVIQERKKGRLQRRVYNVKGPNHLWHNDTNHKLIRGHFVIVGGIEVQCKDNNKSATVLECFLSGVSKFGLPHRVT
jgi:hypothetical protein